MASIPHKTGGPGAQPPVVSPSVPGFENMRQSSSVKGNPKPQSSGRDLLNREVTGTEGADD